MTDRELMQQALKALEVLAKYENPLTKIQVRKPRDGGPIVTMYPHQVATNAAELLRGRLAQPEQEPVAWMHNSIEGNVIAHRPADLDRHPERWTALYQEPRPCPTCEALSRAVMMDQTSHDTPRREWVGLTDREIEEIARYQDEHGSGPWHLAFARAIEAKLKEKA